MRLKKRECVHTRNFLRPRFLLFSPTLSLLHHKLTDLIHSSILRMKTIACWASTFYYVIIFPTRPPPQCIKLGSEDRLFCGQLHRSSSSRPLIKKSASSLAGNSREKLCRESKNSHEQFPLSVTRTDSGTHKVHMHTHMHTHRKKTQTAMLTGWPRMANERES